jgi:UDP-N-acetylglucosamine transferase subunit ALG13
LIFVTVGTQRHSFGRLIDTVVQSAGQVDDTIYIQAGHTLVKNPPLNVSYTQFMPRGALARAYKDASVVLTHGGTGSVMVPLLMGVPVIAVPRLQKFGEHVDDHQCELIGALVTGGHVLEWDPTILSFREILDRVAEWKPVLYKSTNDKFRADLMKLIREI